MNLTDTDLKMIDFVDTDEIEKKPMSREVYLESIKNIVHYTSLCVSGYDLLNASYDILVNGAQPIDIINKINGKETKNE